VCTFGYDGLRIGNGLLALIMSENASGDGLEDKAMPLNVVQRRKHFHSDSD
jgi:hypothetical protein